MSRINKWQCPHCYLSCSRHWNSVVDIRRKHGGVGQPIDKEDPSGSRNTSSSNLNGTHTHRRPSPTCNFNRSSINYSNHASKDIGDMIDEMHQMLTELEKRRRKLEEIIEIAHKYQPFPIEDPYNDVSNATIKYKEKTVPQNIPSQDTPSSHDVPVQTHNYGIGVTSQKTKAENALQDIPAGQHRETNWGSMRTENLVNRNEDIWDADPPPEEPWVIKLDMYGDIVDAYRAWKDPMEELRYIAKQYEKSTILYH